MSIFSHFPSLTLTSDQLIALENISNFLQSNEHVFILKGYAGTGKTTLIKGITSYLKEQKKSFQVMAPTGRAAKILRDKVDLGSTIHKGIYSFDNLIIKKSNNQEDENDVSFQYIFPVQKTLTLPSVCIIDEASMISDNETKHEHFIFGTGRLLSDILTYIQLPQRGKLIIVGDPAQLPPYNENISKALNEKFFSEKGISVQSIELKQICRQDNESYILKNAHKFREVLETEKRNELQFEYNEEVHAIDIDDVAQKYVVSNPVPKIGDSVVIAFSNNQCLALNQAIRDLYFPEKKSICVGDIISLNNNNYHTYGAELFNGDLVEIVNVSENTEIHTTPIWALVDGKKERKMISISYRDVRIRVPHFPNEIACKIVDSLLNSPFRDLDVDELKAMFIDFRIRFSEEQKLNKNKGLPEIKTDSNEYKLKLRHDPYYNALRVKYGYALTCHKAQGGEWENVFVDFTGRVGLNDAHLRWGYTAITRSSKNLFVVNAPYFESISQIEFKPIEKIGNIPANIIRFGNIPETPFHNKNTHPAKRVKYFEIVDRIKTTQYVLDRVESRDYQEMYYFMKEELLVRCDTTHNQAGIFKPFSSASNDEVLLNILNKENDIDEDDYEIIQFQYSPSTSYLEKLYSTMQMLCSALKIKITNIEEQTSRFYIIYFLKTTAICSYLQFYFDKNGKFTTVYPKSDKAQSDSKLQELINQFQLCHSNK